MEALAILDRALTGRDWLLGEAFTLADVNVAATLNEPWEKGLIDGDLDPAEHGMSALGDWLRRCTGRELLDPGQGLPAPTRAAGRGRRKLSAAVTRAADSAKSLVGTAEVRMATAEGLEAAPEAPSALSAAARFRIIAYFGGLIVLMGFPGNIIGVPVGFFLKNKLHLAAHQVAIFGLISSIPALLRGRLRLRARRLEPVRLGRPRVPRAVRGVRGGARRRLRLRTADLREP